MVHIWFETHATTLDNETNRSSGWNDVRVSKAGIKEAKDLGKRRNLNDFDIVFTSDLVRAYHTATLAFGENTKKIFQDWRLREVDYGDMTSMPKDEMNKDRPSRIKNPYPNGESFEMSNMRMFDFLKELAKTSYKEVLIIGHRATHYGLETYITGKPLEECINESLSWKWQPGWEYELK